MLMRRLIRSERGNAMVTALGVLAVTSVVTATVFSVSTTVSDSSNKSRDSKTALAAADAGLEAAVYRLNMQNLENTTSCFTTGLVSEVNGECPGQTESLGNNMSYTYYVTPALAEGETCAGVPISYTGDEAIAITQRCVTVAGTANDVTRRVQARVASYIGLQLLSLGILGLDGVEFKNSGDIDAWIGSNGEIDFDNSSTVTGIELGPSAPNPSFSNGSSVGSITRRSVSQGSHILAPVDVGNSATVNDNIRLTNGQDTLSGVSFNSSTRVVSASNNASMTLGGGTYNFCNFTASNKMDVNIAVGAKVRIFIDSPARSGSGCASGTGKITASNKITFNNPGPAENLQIYVYGSSNSGTPLDVDFKNSVDFDKGFIYAPRSKVEFKNSADWVGAVAAKEVEFKNSVDFTWTESLANLRAETLSLFYKTAWKECRSRQTATTDPESGCTT
jgi:Tfp pilus assembly protein PilX